MRSLQETILTIKSHTEEENSTRTGKASSKGMFGAQVMIKSQYVAEPGWLIQEDPAIVEFLI